MTWKTLSPLWLRRLLIAAMAALLPGLGSSGAWALTPVDLELVLAIDVSGSVDFEEAALQRDGYVRAINSPAFAKAVAGGVLGRIAVTYVEWAGDDVQATVLDWRVIDGAASARAFAKALGAAPISTGPWTSISDAISFAVPLLESNAFQGTRRVIDISGDGPNNVGAPVTEARAAAIAKGITINGLAIINDRLQPSGRPQLKDLDRYYAACVIGGPGAFLVAAKDFQDFGRAIRHKLLFEIAGIGPHFGVPGAGGRLLMQNVSLTYPLGCDIGERRLRQLRYRFDDDL
ncbi:MAG: DUF1194 domain-containing protein [Rhodospirillaceae bacterium]|jgi:hypothetical protein|nr:DUF1194 domain-containing protein [Rhodospirillaceae bacterium]MBT3887255.1 DUF1194 domain-containing protein [Rhodospirillaceae bacterium]MBT4117251.1 DUF1194 domain-containing protein [Rhodospirillaceae bacterium]MBT6858457.1 DUF1194 domain-containing protein [Rhodospirillaceae bacterium]MBT7033302.1 DUF1194 domain-containing protein [Rhodospirillaceae bacterium]